MGFRLIYEGELLSSNASDREAARKNKHAIRRQLHKQLKALWRTDKHLRYIANSAVPGKQYRGDEPFPPEEWIGYLASKYERCGLGFVPLIGEEYNLVCSVDVLFLRREPPGAIVQGGDLDNRMNTLFDGLKVPSDCEQITEPPEPDERPMYCLLQDDRLITGFGVTTGFLLRPPIGPSRQELNEVVLVLNVDIKQTGKLW